MERDYKEMSGKQLLEVLAPHHPSEPDLEEMTVEELLAYPLNGQGQRILYRKLREESPLQLPGLEDDEFVELLQLDAAAQEGTMTQEERGEAASLLAKAYRTAEE